MDFTTYFYAAPVLFIGYKILDWLYRYPHYRIPAGHVDYILITGCDTGFGNIFARRLDSKGFHVFACCLTEKGCQELREECSSKMRSFVMDITQDDSVKAGYDLVRNALPTGTGLWALVNNAGIGGDAGCAEWMRRPQIQKVMDVNYISPVMVTHTFLPLVRQAQGRIVNVSSIAGKISLPGYSIYSASKFAIEGYSEGLRVEMRQFNVSVHIIEPGAFATGLGSPQNLTGRNDQIWQVLPDDVKRDYGEDYRLEFLKMLSDINPLFQSPRLHMVVDAYEHAVLATHPRARYGVGYDANYMFLPLQWLPEWLRDSILDKFTGFPLLPASRRAPGEDGWTPATIQRDKVFTMAKKFYGNK